MRASVVMGTIALAGWAAWEVALRAVPFHSAAAARRPAVVVEDRTGTELAAFVGQEDAWYFPLSSREISPWLKKAIVAVEDRRFAAHHGIDWYSAAGALWQDLRALRAARGASTLSMQVIRLREHEGHGWLDKAQQAFRAEQLELHVSKDEILTQYLNRAPFGGNLVGAGAASWRYFGKNCGDLSLGQAALLAGLPQSPTRFQPDKSPEAARVRRAHVLEQMLAAGMITAEDAARANAEPIDAQWRALPQKLTHNAWGALPALAGLAPGAAGPGARLRTTLDAPLQQAADRALEDGWADLAADGIDSACIVVLDVPTGEIRATVSRSTAAPGVDLARAPRSTGSVLKPFLYAAAFDQGILTPQTQLLDSPKAWAGYIPANFDRDFRGNITAADALAESRNIPAMTVLAKLGVRRGISTLSAVGIATPAMAGRNYGLSLAIGGAEATPLEVAQGYATLARGGRPVAASMIENNAPLQTRGATLDEARGVHASACVLRPEICDQTLAAISRRDRTESVAGGAQAPVDTAWKTGTSNGLRDAWCAAVTRRLVVVVWLGNAGGRGNSALVGQAAAAPLALRLMATIDAGGGGAVPWPAGAVSGEKPRVLAADTRLSVTSPAPNTELFTDGQGDPHEAVALKSAGGAGRERWWFANGQMVAQTEGPAAFWRPAAGNYELRVVDEDGAAAVVRVAVH